MGGTFIGELDFCTERIAIKRLARPVFYGAGGFQFVTNGSADRHLQRVDGIGFCPRCVGGNVNGVRSFFGVIEELEVTFAAEWYTGNSAFKSGFVFKKIIPLVEFLHHVVADVHAYLSCGSSNEVVFVV